MDTRRIEIGVDLRLGVSEIPNDTFTPKSRYAPRRSVQQISLYTLSGLLHCDVVFISCAPNGTRGKPLMRQNMHRTNTRLACPFLIHKSQSFSPWGDGFSECKVWSASCESDTKSIMAYLGRGREENRPTLARRPPTHGREILSRQCRYLYVFSIYGLSTLVLL